MGRRYRRGKNQNPEPGLACNLNFGEGEGIEAKVEMALKIV